MVWHAPGIRGSARLVIRVVALAAIAVTLALAVPRARAMQPISGGVIPAGSTIGDDVLLLEDDLTVDGTVDGDLIALGKRVTINGAVNGSVLALGDTVTVNGQVRGAIYVLALSVRLHAPASIGRNAYLVGMQVQTDPGSRVGRDVTVGAYRAVIGGQTERDLKTAVLLLDLQGQLRGRPPRSTPSPTSGFTALAALVRPVAELSQFGDGHADSFEPPAVSGQESSPHEAGESPVSAWFGRVLRNAVILLLVGALLLFVAPRRLTQWSERVRQEPLPSAGYGVLAFVLFYLLALAVAAFVAIVGVALVLTRLGGSVLPLYSFGFFGIGFALSAFTLFYSTVSQVIVALLMGRLILQRAAPRYRQEHVLALVLGAALLSLFVAVPVAGAVIDAMAGFVALGGVWLVFRGRGVEGSVAVTAAAAT